MEVTDTLRIRGIDSLEGDYSFDMAKLLGITVDSSESLTNGELHQLKVMTGLRVLEIIQAFDEGDNDILVGLAAVVLRRHGKVFKDDLLWDAPAGGSIQIDLANREDQDSPPASGPGTESADSPLRPNDAGATMTSSGDVTGEDSVSLESDLAATGHPV